MRDEILEIVHDIRNDLANRETSRTVRTPPGFSQGAGAAALLHTYLWRANGLDEDRNTALQLLEASIDQFDSDNQTALRPALYGGFVGLGWLTAHLSRHIVETQSSTFDDIDEALLVTVRDSTLRLHFDLISGLAGIGVYAAERLPDARTNRLLESVVDRLAQSCITEAEGATWCAYPEYLADWEREISSDVSTLRNLGIAHGIPGVIATLSVAYGRGIVSALTPLRSGLTWLTALPAAKPDAAGFPVEIGLGVNKGPARIAWCYGDAGVAAALLLAARTICDERLEDAAIGIAKRTAMRPAERSGVVDAGICHGAAGLAHIFNRLFQATQLSLFADMSRFWIKQTLQMRRPTVGYGGFQSLRGRPVGNTGQISTEWEDDSGFLTGSVGIALVLLSAVTPVPPDWDAVLLTNVPGHLLLR